MARWIMASGRMGRLSQSRARRRWSISHPQVRPTVRPPGPGRIPRSRGARGDPHVDTESGGVFDEAPAETPVDPHLADAGMAGAGLTEEPGTGDGALHAGRGNPAPHRSLDRVPAGAGRWCTDPPDPGTTGRRAGQASGGTRAPVRQRMRPSPRPVTPPPRSGAGRAPPGAAQPGTRMSTSHHGGHGLSGSRVGSYQAV